MPKFEGYKVGDMQSSEPVPEATYRLRINGVEYRDPDALRAAGKKTDAKFPGLAVDFVVQDEGENFGRHIFQHFTMKKGGDFALRGLLEAMGKDDEWVLDTDEMTDGEVMGVVTIDPEKENPDKPGEKYPAKNNIKRFMPVF